MNAQIKIEPATSVYAKIAAVQGELAQTGIGKDSENTAQGFKFRGIDAVYNALSPLLAKHRLCILPRMVDHERVERVTVKTWNGQSKESVTFHIKVAAEFDFVSADDGSIHVVRTYGEAMDNGDKATNKAMSAAYKYAAFMAFAIPTEGDNDADASTHEVVAKAGGDKAGVARSAPPPLISDDQLGELELLLDHLNVPVAEVLNVGRLQTLKDLSADRFDGIKNWINNRAIELRKVGEPA